MAPPKPPKTKAGFAARLTRKVGPLPVWAWAAVILGSYLLYRRLAGSTPATSSTDATPTPTADTSSGFDSGAQVPASGQGSPADNLSAPALGALAADTSGSDAVLSALQSLPTFTDLNGLYDAINARGEPPGSTGAIGPAATTINPEAVPTPHPTRVGAPAGHLTQADPGLLKWGGLTFKTQASFDAWARAHGTTTRAELNNHPQAKAVYSTLTPSHSAPVAKKAAKAKPQPKAATPKKPAAPKKTTSKAKPKPKAKAKR